MVPLFPHSNVKSPFEDAIQTWMGHFQFLARTSALPLWIWQLELGMLSVWRTASCCTTDWSMNWLKLPTSSLEINKPKFSETRRRCTQAVGHEQTSESRKPAMQQLESNKCQRYQATGWDSLVGLMMVVRLMLVQIGLNLCMPQAWRKARYSFHRLVVNSSTAFTSDLTLPFSAHSITSWQNLDIGCTQVRNLS